MGLNYWSVSGIMDADRLWQKEQEIKIATPGMPDMPIGFWIPPFQN